MARRPDLRALCEHLAPEDRVLAGDVALAERDPAAFVRRHAERLANRGIDSPRDDLGWIALVDGLLARGLLAELDWMAAPEDVMASLDHVIEKRGFAAFDWSWYEEAAFGGADLDVFLAAVAGSLPAAELALVELDIASDSHPLTVVRAGEAAAIVRDARACGFRAVHWTAPR